MKNPTDSFRDKLTRLYLDALAQQQQSEGVEALPLQPTRWNFLARHFERPLPGPFNQFPPSSPYEKERD